MKTALIVVDVQNDYFPGGKLELVNMEPVTQVIRQLLDRFRQDQEPVIHVQHIFTNDDAPFFVANTHGVEIHESVRPQMGETLVVKHAPNSFHETNLDAVLKQQNVEQLLIVGAQTHICIDATVKAAFDLGYKVLVAEEASATRDVIMNDKRVPAATVQATFLAGMHGIFATVVSTKEWLDR